ncbi:MAG: hypothetical protein U0264_16495 [Candidatus Kapaibacterium sp.]
MGFIKNFFAKQHEWVLNGHDKTDQWKSVKVGDTVEFAMTMTEGVTYSVESINQEAAEAKIRRRTSDGSNGEAYTVGLVMLRPIAKTK